MKKFLSVLLVLVMVASMLPGIHVSACAAEDAEEMIYAGAEDLSSCAEIPSVFYVRRVAAEKTGDVSGEPDEESSVLPSKEADDPQDPHGYLAVLSIKDPDLITVEGYDDGCLEYGSAGEYFVSYLFSADSSVFREPEPVTYVIQYGDTLCSIAEKYGTTFWEIARANNKPDPNIVEVGEVLVIPGAEEPAPSVPVPIEVRVPVKVLEEDIYDEIFVIEDDSVLSEAVEGELVLASDGVIAVFSSEEEENAGQSCEENGSGAEYAAVPAAAGSGAPAADVPSAGSGSASSGASSSGSPAGKSSGGSAGAASSSGGSSAAPAHTHTWVTETVPEQGHYENRQTGTVTVVDSAAWTETTPGYYQCVSCGATFSSGEEADIHSLDVCGSGYRYVGGQSISHPAVTHEEAVYGDVWVVDVPASTRTYCSECGASQ